MHNSPIRHPVLKPLSYRRTCGVGVWLIVSDVLWKGIISLMSNYSLCSPKGWAYEWDLSLTTFGFYWPLRICLKIYKRYFISDINVINVKTAASDRRIPVSLINAINHRLSSSRVKQSFCKMMMFDWGIGSRLWLDKSSGMYAAAKTLLQINPCSLIAKFRID